MRSSDRPGSSTRRTLTLPDFIVLGAMRAGTTTLYELLASHDEIGMSREKETDFFIVEKNWRLGFEWYAQQFDGRGRMLGEASPNYAMAADFAGVPERIAEALPDCRFIFIVRDPVARAISQYRCLHLSGFPVPSPADLLGSRCWNSMIDVSSYHRQISLYLRHYAAERFLFLDFDELSTTPAATLSRVAAFLDVADEWSRKTRDPENASEALARTPRWLLRLRQDRATDALRRWIPRPLRRLGARAAAIGPRRDAPVLDERLQARLAEAVRGDAERFRALAGMAFPHWSV